MSLFILLERLQYESRPVMYAFGSIYSVMRGFHLALADEQIARWLVFAGLMLAYCSLAVIKMRYEYRLK